MSIDLNRDALVVGICQYDSLTMSEELKTLAKQAEQLAQLLETKGDFKIKRLPCTVEMCLHLKERVTSFKLKKAIEELFYPPEQAPTQTALLFFAGHGLMESTRVGNEGFLATSEADNKSVYGVSYQWLAKTLCNSPIKQQIVFIEACYSGGFINTITGMKETDKDICLIASSQANQTALANGLLTQDLLDILKNPNMTTNVLIKELQKREKQPNRGSQRFQIKTQGTPILITEKMPIEKNPKSTISLFLIFGIIIPILAFLFLNTKKSEPPKPPQVPTYTTLNVLSNGMFRNQGWEEWIDSEKQENAIELAKQKTIVKKEKSIPEQLKILKKETGIVISEPTQKAEWIANYNLPITHGTYNIIVLSPKNENMGKKKIEELTKKYPYVNFTLHNTENNEGKNKRLAIFIGHGLTQEQAKKLVSWTKKVGIAKGAYYVQNIWNELELVSSLERDTSTQNIWNTPSNPEIINKSIQTSSIEIIEGTSNKLPLISEDFPTIREQWKKMYHRPLQPNTWNVIVKSIPVKSNNEDKANEESQDKISKLSQTYLNVYFDSYVTEDESGNKFHSVIYIGSGLTQTEAKKLKLWAIEKGIASDAFIVKNNDEHQEDDSEEN